MLVRNHPPDLWRISVAHERVVIELAFALGRLGGKNVALKSLAAFDLSARGFFKAFGCALMGFQFWHIRILEPLPAALTVGK